jgi:hypothetical protein
MKTELKVAAIRSGKSQYLIAQELGWHPSKLSQIISGCQTPCSEDKRLLSQYFDLPVQQLFSTVNEEGQNAK